MFHVSPLSLSPFDSARFGLCVCRASYEHVDESELITGLLENMADVAIYRMPTSSSSSIDGLQHYGFEVIHAGVLVYYTVDLTTYKPKTLRNTDLNITVAEASDDAELAELARLSFAGFKSHYSANPLFPADKILEGYCEWTLRHRLAPNRTITWVARRDGHIIAYACCEFDEKSKICDGGIYGVLPQEASRGLFSDLIRFTQCYFRERGYKEMRMSAKVGNFAVQKVWIREGYYLYEAYDTFHVNSMLSAGERYLIQNIRLPCAAVDQLMQRGNIDALVTEDLSQAASRAGFLFEPEIMAQARAHHQGISPVLVQASQLVLRTLQPDCNYLLEILFPPPSFNNGLRLAVVFLRDDVGICMLGYYRLRIS